MLFLVTVVALAALAVMLLLLLILCAQVKIMSDVDDLKAVVDELAADEATLAGNVATILEELKTLQGQPAPDLSGVIAQLSTLHTKLQADNASLVAAETPQPPTTPAV